MYKKKDRRGAKRKTPDTAIGKLIYDYGMSMYSVQKHCSLSTPRVYNSSREDISRLRLDFFIELGKALHLKTTTVIAKLLKLQKQYPPKLKKRKSSRDWKNKSGRTR